MLTVADMNAKCRRIENLGLVVIDYLQLMTSSGGKSYSGENRQQAVSDIYRMLKIMEQDADIVMFLYREDYYKEDTENKNIAECIVAKNRHGEVGKLPLRWMPEYTTFSTIERRFDEE